MPTRSQIIKELSTKNNNAGRYFLDKLRQLTWEDQEIILRCMNDIILKQRSIGVMGALELLSKIGSYINQETGGFHE